MLGQHEIQMGHSPATYSKPLAHLKLHRQRSRYIFVHSQISETHFTYKSSHNPRNDPNFRFSVLVQENMFLISNPTNSCKQQTTLE